MTLAAGLALSSIGVSAIFAEAETNKQTQSINPLERKVINKIKAENMYDDIAYLSQTPRVAGTEAEWNAIQYVKNKFESYGYQTELQEFDFYGYTAPHTVELSVSGYSGDLDPRSFSFGEDGNVTGELVYVGLGTKEELANQDLTGKIAIVQRGNISFAEKVLNAAEKGALGVIIFNNTSGVINGTLGEPNENYVPVVSITQDAGQALVESLNNGNPLTASINIEGAVVEKRISYNVIATKEPTNKNRGTNDIVAVGAHVDSVDQAPGANDDASGTSMVLELARVFKDLPTDKEMRFMIWGAEELGLIGSRYYASQLSDEEKERFIGYFNLDMVGSRDAGDLVINVANGVPNIVSDTAQASSARLNGSPTPLQVGGSSDHVAFTEIGIPAASFIHRPLEPWYHTPEDTVDKISKEKLQDVAEIVGTAMYDLTRPDYQGPKGNKGKQQKLPELYHELETK